MLHTFKEAFEKPFKNADLMLGAVRRQAERLGMKEGSLGAINGHDLVYFSGGKGPVCLMVSSGIHGPEIAGPLGLYVYLLDLKSLPEGVLLTIFPTMNPTGIDRRIRKNAWGQATNDNLVTGTKSAPGREGKLILAAKGFMRERSKDGALSLHEDNLKGVFYIYSFERSKIPGPFSGALVQTGMKHFPLADEGHCPNEDRPAAKVRGGVIYHDHDGSLEDMLFHLGARHTAVIETPQQSPLADRVRCQADCIRTFVAVSATRLPKLASDFFQDEVDRMAYAGVSLG